MKQLVTMSVVLMLAVAVFAPLAPVGDAQVTNAYTTIATLPANLQFSVDNQVFTQAMGAFWPAGSKHTLFALPIQYSLLGDMQYSFLQWQWSGGPVAGGNLVVVTADPSISTYTAQYSTSYAVSLNYFNCPSGNCPSPGTVYINGSPYVANTTVFLPAASNVVLQAFPSDGFVFAGWGSITSGAVIQGFQQTFVLNQPMVFYPKFQLVREINLLTIPAGLQVYADRSPVTSPAALQWGIGSVHTVGGLSPQQDKQGNYWMFSSWSDGGAATHAYTVASSSTADTLTATYAPATPVGFSTDPPGLSLSIDGRTNWPSYNFTWGVGEVHTFAAPAQQTDAQGNLWNFTKWSNGGPASQSLTVSASAAAAGGMRFSASYTQAAHLTVSSSISGLAVSVNGSPCALPCDVFQPLGSQVDVGVPASIALASGSRQDFLSWSINGAIGTGTAANGDLLVTLGSAPVTVAPVYHLMNSLAVTSNPVSGATFGMQPVSPDGFYDSQASVTVTASIQPGYKFRAWSGDLAGAAATATLSMSAPRSITALLDPVPYILPNGIVNGAGVTPQAAVAPGSVVSVFGANLASTVAVGPASPLLQTLGGVTARLGSQVLPLYFVSPSQINFQLPPGLPSGPQTLTISSNGQADVQGVFQVAADAPGIFPASVADGVTFGVVTHSDGTPVTSSAPAQAAETLTVFGTGFGATVPARPEGFAVPASPGYLLTDPATVQIGGVPVDSSAAFAWPGSVGVDVIQFVVPGGLPPGANAPLTVTVGGAISNTVALPVQ